MKTQTLQEAITFALSIDKIATIIEKMEANPGRFAIASISADVTNYPASVIRVIINFREKPSPFNIKEDAIIQLQGTSLTNFRVLGIVSTEFAP